MSLEACPPLTGRAGLRAFALSASEAWRLFVCPRAPNVRAGIPGGGTKLASPLGVTEEAAGHRKKYDAAKL